MTITTTNLSDFGSRERMEMRLILESWEKYGLPDEFDFEGVQFMMNTNSGNVFLTNDEYQVCMLNGSILELFHSCPECGNEGFKEDLLDVNNTNQCCIDFIEGN